MGLFNFHTSTKRSGPIFVERDGVPVSKVYQVHTRAIRLGGKDGLHWTLPARSSVFIIDSHGVWHRNVGGDLPGAFAVGVALTILLAIAGRVSASRRPGN